MAGLLLRHVYKVYAGTGKAKKNAKGEAKKRSGDFVAVKDFNMEIKDGEFIVFVGPSGCGKSTTLRMIAGLEEISSGELYIGDRLVNDVDAKDRDIAMVFQSYALYPHLTAYDNIAFGLKIRKIPKPKLDKEGNQIVGFDVKKIKELTKKIKKTKKEILGYEVAVAENEQELVKLDETAEAELIESIKRDIKYAEEQKVFAERRLKESEESLEYYSSNQVPLFN